MLKQAIVDALNLKFGTHVCIENDLSIQVALRAEPTVLVVAPSTDVTVWFFGAPQTGSAFYAEIYFGDSEPDGLRLVLKTENGDTVQEKILSFVIRIAE